MKRPALTPLHLRASLEKRKRRKSDRVAVGESPTHIAKPPGASDTQVTIIRYGTDVVERVESDDPTLWKDDDLFRWIDVSGLEDHNQITKICQSLNLHSLTIADLFHTDQRSKTEVSENYVQTILRMPAGGTPFEADQLTIVIGADYVFSLREHAHDCFAPVRKRLNEGGTHIRSSPGYLAYALIDMVIDSYFPILEHYGDITETLEEHVLAAPQDGAIRDIHLLKRELLDLRHALWPLREAVNALLRDDIPHIDEKLKPYLRDCADHVFQLLDMVEVYREVAQGLVDLHLSSLSNRMNEVMKVLTIIATIFIAMTFIAGLYGMNFDRGSPYNLPELSWRFGYLYALGLMGLTASVMLFFFWRLGWLFGKKNHEK